MSLSLRTHKRRACAGMARRFAEFAGRKLYGPRAVLWRLRGRTWESMLKSGPYTHNVR